MFSSVSLSVCGRGRYEGGNGGFAKNLSPGFRLRPCAVSDCLVGTNFHALYMEVDVHQFEINFRVEETELWSLSHGQLSKVGFLFAPLSHMPNPYVEETNSPPKP